jgi:menaquinone-dependent protoporphyrinogen oxidase
VLDAPFYMGRWHKDAQRFLVEHREALTQRPVAIFALGPLSADEQEILESRDQLDKELEKYP